FGARAMRGTPTGLFDAREVRRTRRSRGCLTGLAAAGLDYLAFLDRLVEFRDPSLQVASRQLDGLAARDDLDRVSELVLGRHVGVVVQDGNEDNVAPGDGAFDLAANPVTCVF